ncbi:MULTISPECIES: class I SAM-dependent methyltransferase [Mycobacteriaceae]|uniref:class I SAM-dependent methyltransferase n=1 Tax=Mycobacteriaceae TaxID=1762 RepID=UPI0034CEDDCA
MGCGEGIVSRALATAGARVVGVDPTRTLLAHAEATERVHPAGVVYRVDDGTTLGTVSDDSMDGVTAALSLNNIADLDAAVGSVGECCARAGSLPSPCHTRASTPLLPRQSRHRTDCAASPGTTSLKGCGGRRARTAFGEPATITAPCRPTSTRS